MARIYLILFFIYTQNSFCQKFNTQGWLEAMATAQSTPTLSIENAFTFSTLYGNPKWRAFDYSLCLERNMNSHFDLIAQGIVSYTVQTKNYNTLELRPILGFRWYVIKPNAHRLHIRFLFRMEQRNFLNLEDKSWERSFRPRGRLELIVPLNNTRLNQDHTWYGMIDFEYLYYSDDITERFANKSRSRLGMGYRVNDYWRFEAITMYQQSVNNIGENFERADLIFRFRIRYFLPSKYALPSDGIGN